MEAPSPIPAGAIEPPPGWRLVRDCPLGGPDAVLPWALLHPRLGVALGGVAEPLRGEAVARLRARLEAARFSAIFPGHLPILLLDDAALAGLGLEEALRRAFARGWPLALPGGDAWVGAVERALLADRPVPEAPAWRQRRLARRRRPWRLAATAAAVVVLGVVLGVALGRLVTVPRPGTVPTAEPAAAPLAEPERLEGGGPAMPGPANEAQPLMPALPERPADRPAAPPPALPASPRLEDAPQPPPAPASPAPPPAQVAPPAAPEAGTPAAPRRRAPANPGGDATPSSGAAPAEPPARPSRGHAMPGETNAPPPPEATLPSGAAPAEPPARPSRGRAMPGETNAGRPPEAAPAPPPRGAAGMLRPPPAAPGTGAATESTAPAPTPGLLGVLRLPPGSPPDRPDLPPIAAPLEQPGREAWTGRREPRAAPPEPAAAPPWGAAPPWPPAAGKTPGGLAEPPREAEPMPQATLPPPRPWPGQTALPPIAGPGYGGYGAPLPPPVPHARPAEALPSLPPTRSAAQEAAMLARCQRVFARLRAGAPVPDEDLGFFERWCQVN